MTEADLLKIERRVKETTPGPWFWNSYFCIFSAVCEVTGVVAPNCYPKEGSEDDHDDWCCTPSVASVPPSYGDTATGTHAADADFIAHARADVPRLIAALRESWAEIARLRRAIEVALAEMPDSFYRRDLIVALGQEPGRGCDREDG